MATRKQKLKKDLEQKRAARQNKTPRLCYKYLLTLAYDGSNYGGYAKQKHKNTIQNYLENALGEYFKQPIPTTESSRTDAKVHALNQKVMFEWHESLALSKVRMQLNEILPKEIIIVQLEQVAADFHCRHQVKNKTYEYIIESRLDPRANHYAWHLDQKLDLERMKQASRCLIGTHDFTTFKSAKATTDTSIRTVNFLDILEEKGRLVIRINADGFLYNMVRLIVKALVDVGTHRKEISYIKELLELKAKPDNLESAPAQGLCLMEINY